ncbi:LOW QUALITY PROTEIN: G-type lectin S-receptor-like serine/threonine-protein kinase SD2-5 [Populus alba]|uniref:LOW QUALITY PROTEIN: G-type lectin S-receptor-like serine/threonine-protein kinase SD2-5 n=1 Tax=Populus alba TaxID=43335 RepID=UPI00158D1BAB|nr:LOW QUALITY PROTEIN: G-type lectin S-receptor-like serine/threonine-protein kinase At5g35370 [Populus alba]
MAIWPLSDILLVQLLIMLSPAYLLEALTLYPTGQISTSLTNNMSIPARGFDSYQMILMSESGSFACGFHSKDQENDSFYFAVVSLHVTYYADDRYSFTLQNVIWLANENKPVGQNATLKLLPEGNLVLRDADGALVWSTNTSNMSVAGIKMMKTGMLVLQDHNNKTVWQSFSTTAHVSTSWTNNDPISAIPYNLYKISMMHGAGFSCGFHSKDRNSFYFAIWKQSEVSGDDDPEALWLANRNRPVGENATLQFLPDGDLVLRDTDGTFVWSTNTSNMSVAGMRMMETGNLELYDVNNKTVWNSFDHPSDVLLLGNKLVVGQKLVASVSKTDRSEGGFSLFVIPQASPDELNTTLTSTVKYSATAYMKFDPDGHLRIYDGNMIDGVDLLTDMMSACDYPTACGNYGLCLNGQCSCPAGFARAKTPNDQGNYSCSQISPTTCENPKSHSLLPLEDVYYFNYVDPEAAVLKGTDMKSCKDACMKNCSCNAALFQYYGNVSHGNCFLPSPVLTLTGDGKERNNFQSYAFIKISNDGENGSAFTSSINPKIIAGSTIGAILVMSLIIGLCIMVWRKKRDREEGMEDLNQLSGMPMRFTYQELRVATWDFEKKLGGGGFGSVYEGILENGEKIAVKRLDALGQGQKEFLAEVKSIGSIHHVSLARLIGFCADKLHTLLVYEFMCCGSLDKWIFCREPLLHPLDFQTRRNIIMDVAKGLAYLHEECRQRIVHLDIKPQNILLDENLHAKISDFGLSKLIDRDQSQVVTTMRGTPGYLAPELFSSVITEKADVYSFGIVVMEVVCGKKNLDRSQPECMHLLPILMKRAQEDQLIDMVDNSSEDMQLHRLEAAEMMRVAIWCLQSDHTRRPSMSTVVKVLEGTMGVEADLDYCLQNATTMAAIRREAVLGSTTTFLPSLLSGPR